MKSLKDYLVYYVLGFNMTEIQKEKYEHCKYALKKCYKGDYVLNFIDELIKENEQLKRTQKDIK